MSSDNFELSEGTLRQRRNLMTVTVSLIFIHFARVTFDTQMKIMGASITIKNPDFILYFILMTQAYFLWRFYQYFHNDKAHSILKSQFNTSLDSAQNQELRNHIFKNLPNGVNSISGNIDYSNIKKLDPSGGFYEVTVTPLRPDGTDSEKLLIEVPIKKIEKKKIPVLLAFAFRGKILTDFYFPFVLVIFTVVLNFV